MAILNSIRGVVDDEAVVTSNIRTGAGEVFQAEFSGDSLRSWDGLDEESRQSEPGVEGLGPHCEFVVR